MIEIPKLTPRLRAAADLIAPDAFIADVGTDHAYLPIVLCLEERVRGGVVSDINKGPIERARENINKYGLDKRLFALKTDGLDGIEGYCPDHIMILGMGGELIARILSDALWTKSEGICLCLQPMTHPEKLREFLLAEGYSVIDERIVVEEKEDKIYQIILARYSGISEEYREEQLLLGKINIERGGEELLKLARHHISVLSRRVEGKRSAGADASAETELIERIQEVINDCQAAL